MLVAKTFRGSNKSTTCVKLLLIDKGFFLWMQENVKIRTAKQRGALSDVPGTVRNVMCAKVRAVPTAACAAVTKRSEARAAYRPRSSQYHTCGMNRRRGESI
jgi:hypothetical protein